jgi:hypothetical protein
VREIVPIDLPRPRETQVKRSTEFQALVEHIAHLLDDTPQ